MATSDHGFTGLLLCVSGLLGVAVLELAHEGRHGAATILTCTYIALVLVLL